MGDNTTGTATYPLLNYNSRTAIE
jgi:hypothetical protein